MLQTTAPIRILLIHDNPGDARLLRLLLQTADPNGFEIAHVCQLTDALEHLSEEAVDVVLLDVSQPDARGIEVFETAFAHAPTVPFVLIGNESNEETELAAARKGAQDYLIKGMVNYENLARSLRYAVERNRIELMQRELEREKSEFISCVSHELRTPLHSIKGFLKLLLMDKVNDRETEREFLSIVYDQSAHLGNLIEDLFDASQIESGSIKIHKEPRPVGDVLAAAATSMNGLAQDKGVSILINIPESLPVIDIDDHRIKQVMTNLLGNAIKFSGSGTEISIAAKPEGGEVLVQVSDQGIGVPGNAIPNLFDRFYRVDNSSLREAGGNGLGLFISKYIVEGHGGRIWVESEIDNGSVFSFTLPITPVSGKREEETEGLLLGGVQQGQPRRRQNERAGNA